MGKSSIGSQLQDLYTYYRRSVGELKVYDRFVREKRTEHIESTITMIKNKLQDYVKASLKKKAMEQAGEQGLTEQMAHAMSTRLVDSDEKGARETAQSITDLFTKMGFPFADDIVHRMVLVYGVIIFEEMVKAYLRLLFVRYKGQLRSKTTDRAAQQDKQIDYETALSVTSVKQLREVIIQRELDKLGRMSIDEIDKYFSEKMNLSLSRDFVEWQVLRKCYYARNLIVHNRGMMNREVYNKIKLCKVGELIKPTQSEVGDLVSALEKLNKHLMESFRSKLRADVI